MPVEKSCGAVVVRKEPDNLRYLLLHYESGHWDFVKGNIDEGESEKETVEREAKEETGISSLQFVPGFREKINYFYKSGSQVIYKEVIFYLAETREKKVKISHEHIGYDWLGYEGALKKLTFKNAKGILEKAHEFLERHTSASFGE